MRTFVRLASAFTGLAAVATLWSDARAEPIKIAHAIWVGYGPVFVAQEKGFFAQEGVEVTMINIDDRDAAFAALADGDVDAVLNTVDALVRETLESSDRYVAVLALDDSLGGDGIVAHKDIRSIADLKGRMVGVDANGTVSEFYLNVLLKEAGLSQDDIEVVALSAEDAVNAFVLGDIDVAVTWEPWLSLARAAEHGHLLADSSDHPGLIVDVLTSSPSVLEERLPDFKAFARAWAAAVAYVEAHPEEANRIMAKNVGGWLEDPAVFAETLEGIRFYDAERNREYFGTPENPGQVYDTAQKAIDVWSSLGLVETDLTPADVIAHGIWDE
jgi:NitT/TauT family transport system substrate-binding protein